MEVIQESEKGLKKKFFRKTKGKNKASRLESFTSSTPSILTKKVSESSVIRSETDVSCELNETEKEQENSPPDTEKETRNEIKEEERSESSVEEIQNSQENLEIPNNLELENFSLVLEKHQDECHDGSGGEEIHGDLTTEEVKIECPSESGESLKEEEEVNQVEEVDVVKVDESPIPVEEVDEVKGAESPIPVEEVDVVKFDEPPIPVEEVDEVKVDESSIPVPVNDEPLSSTKTTEVEAASSQTKVSEVELKMSNQDIDPPLKTDDVIQSDLDIPSWDNLHQFQSNLSLNLKREPLESDQKVSSTNLDSPSVENLKVLPTAPSSDKCSAKVLQRPTPHLQSDPPSSQARRKLLSEPELQEFLSVPPFDTQFKSYHKPTTSTPSRKLKAQNEKVPLDFSWKELSDELEFECLDTNKDEAIAFYTMVLWDDLLPPRPTHPVTHSPPPKHIPSDVFGEIPDFSPTHLIDSGPSVAVDHNHIYQNPMVHHLACPSMSHGLVYHPCSPYLYAHQEQTCPRHLGHDPMPHDPYRYQHYTKLAHCGLKTNHSKIPTVKFKSPNSNPPAPSLGSKTKQILSKATNAVRSVFRVKDKKNKKEETEIKDSVDPGSSTIEKEEEAGVVSSTEEILLAQALLLSEQDQNNLSDKMEPKISTENLKNKNSGMMSPKTRGIFSLRRNKKEQV